MNDGYKYGAIKLSYEYLGDEYASSKPHKIEMVISNDVERGELLERFEGFMKAIGYYFNAGEAIDVVNVEMPRLEDWEAKTWDNAFTKKAEQMGDTIAKEYDANVHV
jgi:hypothetical protein